MQNFAHFFVLCALKRVIQMKKIAILASGEGTNAEQIIRHFEASETARVVLVVSNKSQAGVLRRADRLGVPSAVVSAAGFASGEALQVLRQSGADLIVLAGFLLRVPDDILHEWPHRIVNIHPSLLPKFGGKGMYGSNVHRAVIEAGEHESGITIHYIDEHYDQGTVILQATCPVLTDDTPDTLAARVHQLEYKHYPEVIEEVLTSFAHPVF